MYELSVWLTVIIVVLSSVDYIRLMLRREIDPVLATWILMGVVILLSVIMWASSPHSSWKGNIVLVAATGNIGAILSVLVFVKQRDRKLFVAFTGVQKFCLAASAASVVFWTVTNDAFISYLWVQSIALFAYVATIGKLWRAERSSEPLSTWILIFLSCVPALYPALVHHDKFAFVYLGRAMPSTLLLIYLIWRIKKKMRLRERSFA